VRSRLLLAAAVCLFLARPAAAEAPSVFVTIKPLHALVAGVMADVGTPYLLVTGGGSPHHMALKPSAARRLAGADLVVWIGDRLETFMQRPIAALAAGKAVMEIQYLPGLTRWPTRDLGDWHHGDEDDHKHDDHDDEGVDPHLWLDPRNAERIVAHLATRLGEVDPANGARYRANAEAMAARLQDLDRSLEARLAPVTRKPFILFHDGYQYFERRYGLSPIGAVALSPERPSGARHLTTIRRKIAETGATCLFTEPQFPPDLAERLAEGTPLSVSQLDPLGANLTPGPDSYFTMMDNLGRDLVDCLNR